MRNLNKKKAFTLVELVIVIAVIGILAAVLVPTFSGLVKKARYTQDVALVRNINTTLAVDEVLTGSPNDAIELQARIRAYGLSTETKSEGNYLFWDKEANRVVLAGLNETGIVLNNDPSEEAVVALAEGESSKGTLLTANILAPEMFVEGYYFISTASADGFAQAISNIRNGKDIDANLTELAGIHSRVGEILDNFAETAVFIDKDGNQQFKTGVTQANVTTMIVGSETQNLAAATFANITSMNIKVIDIPSNVTSVAEGAVEAMKPLLYEEGIVITYVSDELVNSVKESSAEGKDDVANLLLNVVERKSKVKKVTLVSKYDNSVIGEVVIVNQEESFTINYAFPMIYIGSNVKERAFELTGYSLYEDESVIIAIGTQNYTLTTEEIGLIDAEGTLKMYVMLQEKTAEVKYNDCYYAWSTALEMLNNGKITSGTLITMGKDAVLTKNVTIPSGVTLVVPYAEESETAFVKNEAGRIYFDTNNGANMTAKLTVAEGVTLTNNGTITVGASLGAIGGSYSCYISGGYGVLEVNGDLVSGGTVNAYGFITGSGNMTVNGTLLEALTLEDWPGGSAVAGINNGGTGEENFFNNWTMNNVRVATRLNSTATYTAYTDVYVSSSHQEGTVLFVAPSDALFIPQNADSYVVKEYNSATKGISITAHGDYLDKALTMSIAGYSIDFANRPFPVSNMDIVVASGSTLQLLNSGYKILPGSDIKVEAGATLTVGNKFGVYATFMRTFESGKATTMKYTNSDSKDVTVSAKVYPQDRLSATLQVQGTLNITANAKFSGYIQLQGAGIANIDASATLQTAFKEGTGYKYSSTSYKFVAYDIVTRYTYIDVLVDGNSRKVLLTKEASEIDTTNTTKMTTDSTVGTVANGYRKVGSVYYYYLYDQAYDNNQITGFAGGTYTACA